MKNKDVVRRFIDKEFASGSNLYSSGNKLFSYNTCIAQWWNDMIIINDTRYSSSTSRHQYYLKSLVMEACACGAVQCTMIVTDIEINKRQLC